MKRSLWGCMLFCILSATLSFSQSASTSLRGAVKDPSGALVPGANVAVVNEATGENLSATANSAGFYVFAQLRPARYTITVSASGFAAQSKSAELLVNQPATVDFALTVQANMVTVDVSAAAETLNLTDATMGNSVGNSMIQAVPMEGRDPTSLLSLEPGVLFIGQSPQNADSRQGAVAGGRSDQGNVTLDGLDDNDQLSGTAFQGVLRSTMDSTEEFRVTTSNGTAEAGRSSGAEVNLITKSGANSLHGSLYEYYRPTNTVGNNFFNKNNELSSGEPNVPEKYVQNVFGGSFGGPIKKDKLFYFFNYEGLRRAIDDIVPATVPTASFMQGNLQYVDVNGNTDLVTAAQVTQLDSSCTSPANYFNGAPVCPPGPGPDPNLIAYYNPVPRATGSALGDGLNSGSYFFPSPAPFTQNTSILKFDYDLNSKNRIFARGNFQKDTQAGDENLPGQPPATFKTDNTKGIAGGYTWTPNANIVNDLRYGYIRQGYEQSGLGTGDYVFVRFLTQPTAQNRSTIEHVPVHNVTDSFTLTKGTHTIALGGNWRNITNEHGTNANSFNQANTNPEYGNSSTLPQPLPAVGSGFANSWQIAYSTLVGDVPELTDVFNFNVTSPTTGTALGDGAFVERAFRSNEFEYYLQDTWRARSNLTITYGVRHTLLETPYEMHGNQVAPTLNTDAWYKGREAAAVQGQISEPVMSFAPAGKANGAPGYWPKQKDNFAPRLGVVYSPDSKTSIRASAGIYFDHYGEGLVNSFDQEGSFGLSAQISNPASALSFEASPRFTGGHSLPAYPTSLIPAGTPTQTYPYAPPAGNFAITWGMNNHLKTPYSEAFNFSVQRELPAGFTIEAAYVGRMGRHLLQQLDLAEPVDYHDPGGAGDYFSNGAQLSKITDQNADCYPSGGSCPSVPTIQYFEDVFPYMQNFDYMGESATQAIYNNEWAPNRDLLGETSALADLDFYCYNSIVNVPYNCPTNPDGSPQSRFWSSQFSSLYAWDTIGVSSYNAVQITLRHPFSHGLALDFNYTLSKSLDLNSGTERSNELTSTPTDLLADNGFSGSAIQNTWNPGLNWAPSDFDARSLISADWVYQLPVGRGRPLLGAANRFADAIVGGWQWAGLGRWTSGLPFNVVEPGYTTDWQIEGNGVVTAPVKIRKNLVAGLPQVFDDPNGINSGVATGTPIRSPYPGEAGQRNNFRGDGYFDIDSSLTKTWNLHDQLKLKFAGEVYNITNSNRFDDGPNSLNTVLTQGTLGAYSVTLTTYRRMQFGLRLDF